MNHESGGSIFGRSMEGSRIVSSRHGEFVFSINEEGQFLAMFIKKGVICGYNDDTELAFVSIEAATFLQHYTAENKPGRTKRGKNISELLGYWEKKGNMIFLTIYPSIGVVHAEARNEQDVLSSSEESGINWSEGYGGVLAYGDNGREIQLAFYAMKRGDEMVVSIGEPYGDVSTLIPVSIGNEVDYILELESESPKRYVNLADKILLGR
jgi:hypothetical protein